jgi:MYXO-CTERM domain-containing protein
VVALAVLLVVTSLASYLGAAQVSSVVRALATLGGACTHDTDCGSLDCVCSANPGNCAGNTGLCGAGKQVFSTANNADAGAQIFTLPAACSPVLVEAWGAGGGGGNTSPGGSGAYVTGSFADDAGAAVNVWVGAGGAGGGLGVGGEGGVGYTGSGASTTGAPETGGLGYSFPPDGGAGGGGGVTTIAFGATVVSIGGGGGGHALNTTPGDPGGPASATTGGATGMSGDNGTEAVGGGGGAGLQGGGASKGGTSTDANGFTASAGTGATPASTALFDYASSCPAGTGVGGFTGGASFGGGGGAGCVVLRCTPPAPSTLIVTPSPAVVAPRGAIAFQVSGGSGVGYAWSMRSNASGGAIDASTGAYTAGPTGGVSDVVYVVDSSGNAMAANVTVTAGVAVTPASSTALPGGSLTFDAAGGSGAGYVWSLEINASGGTIGSVSAVYVAGAATGVTDSVRVADSLGNVGTASVAVLAPVSIAPASPAVDPGAALLFQASGGTSSGYVWSIKDNGSGGTIGASTGRYVAGRSGATVDVVHVSDSLGDAADVSVSVGGGLAISPASPAAPPRGPLAFTATGGAGSGFVWSLAPNESGGTIDPTSGAYTAGAIGGVADGVKVTDPLGNARGVSVLVGPGLSTAPASATVSAGGAIHFAVAGGSGKGLGWTLAENESNGRVAQDGTYTAGASAGSDVVQVVDSLGNVASADVLVLVPAPGADAGDAATPSDAGARAGDAGTAPSSRSSSSCGCRAAGEGAEAPSPWSMVALLAGVLAAIRRAADPARIDRDGPS